MTVSSRLDTFDAHKRDRYLWWVGALWLVACAAMLAVHWHNIATFDFPDVDDQLRLVEVRDWLGGQGFFDVSQHRMNAPFGAPMHWSRLVDMPIAALILALRPMCGPVLAERIAVAAVPLLTLGVAMLAVGLIARRLGGRAAGLLAVALAPTAVAAMVQLQPMRIDHHGWEMALSLLALLAVLRGEDRRGGLWAGLANSVALQISLEVLPFAVALGGALAVQWIVAPGRDEKHRLVGYVATLAVAEALLFAGLHRPDQWGAFCDAVSPPHLLGLAVAAVGVALVARIDPTARWQRLAGLGVVALLAAAAFHAVPPGCGVDAFSSLEPIVRTYWYDKVAEGQPLWREDAATAIGVIGFPLVALPCALVVWRDTRSAEWGLYAAMLAAATLVAVTVLRAGALANLLAVPAAAWAAVRLVARAQASGAMLVRVFGSVAALVALSPWAPGGLAASVIPDPKSAHAAPRDATCGGIASVRALNALPPARIFAPFGFGPGILLETRDDVLASSHHRNHVAMADELRAMMGDAATAHAVLARRGIAYVVSCPAYGEMGTYVAAAPHGFAEHLGAHDVPAWLSPVRVPGSRLDVWKVRG